MTNKYSARDALDRPAFQAYPNPIVTQQLGNECWAQLTNNSTTGILHPKYPFEGQEIKIQNLTNATFTTGDEAIPSGSTWTIGWDGSSWQVLTQA